MSQNNGFILEGNLNFISQGINCRLDVSGGDPDRNLSEEELKLLMKDCRAAIETVLGNHFSQIEIVGKQL